jgi:hypothetical protein
VGNLRGPLPEVTRLKSVEFQPIQDQPENSVDLLYTQFRLPQRDFTAANIRQANRESAVACQAARGVYVAC